MAGFFVRSSRRGKKREPSRSNRKLLRRCYHRSKVSGCSGTVSWSQEQRKNAYGAGGAEEPQGVADEGASQQQLPIIDCAYIKSIVAKILPVLVSKLAKENQNKFWWYPQPQQRTYILCNPEAIIRPTVEMSFSTKNCGAYSKTHQNPLEPTSET